MRKRGLAAAVLGCVALGMMATPARADDDGGYSFGDAGYHLLNGRWGAVTGFYGEGASHLGARDRGLDPRLTGLRYTERKGFVTGFFFALMNSIAGGMAAAGPKSVESWRSGDYIITRTTYHSEAEKAEIRERTARASSEMMSAEDQSFDLEVYMTRLPGGGEASGYKLNMFFGAELGEYAMLDAGLGWGSVESRFQREGEQVAMRMSYFGVPIRLNVAAGPALLTLQWDWNWLGDWSGHEADVVAEPGKYKRQLVGSHWELGLTTALFERVLLQGSVTTPALDSGLFGFRASAGLRF